METPVASDDSVAASLLSWVSLMDGSLAVQGGARAREVTGPGPAGRPGNPRARRFDRLGTLLPMTQLLGQTVVLLGGSAGIGLETARLARREGAEVVLVG